MTRALSCTRAFPASQARTVGMLTPTRAEASACERLARVLRRLNILPPSFGSVVEFIS